MGKDRLINYNNIFRTQIQRKVYMVFLKIVSNKIFLFLILYNVIRHLYLIQDWICHFLHVFHVSMSVKDTLLILLSVPLDISLWHDKVFPEDQRVTVLYCCNILLPANTLLMCLTFSAHYNTIIQVLTCSKRNATYSAAITILMKFVQGNCLG